MSDSEYDTAWETLTNAIGSAKGSSSGSITEIDHLTTDQQLKAAEVVALLAIAQQLNMIRHNGINPEFQDR